MNKDFYKEFYRIYPKLRLSWSLYSAGKRSDEELLRYLFEVQRVTPAMDNGKNLHKRMETKVNYVRQTIGDTSGLIGLEQLLKYETDHYVVNGILDYHSVKFIVDYKSGSTPLKNYREQGLMYNWLNILNQEDDKLKPVIFVRINNDCEITETKRFDYENQEISDWTDKLLELRVRIANLLYEDKDQLH